MVNSPVKNKRKFNESSEDELFFKFENEKKKPLLDKNDDKIGTSDSKKQTLPNLKEETHSEEKCDEVIEDIPKKKSNKILSDDEDGVQNEPKQKIVNKAQKSPKSPNSNNKENKLKSNLDSVKKETNVQSSPVSLTKNKSVIQTKISFGALTSPKPTSAQQKEIVKLVPNDGEWKIEDFLVDKQWMSMLKEEFEKQYFIEINKLIREGYKKNIVRPPKELVFNALNSTNIDKVKNV